MRIIPFVVALLLLCLSLSRLCQPQSVPIVSWKNRFANDAELAGVIVQQYPDCIGEESRFRGKHPAMVIYVFKNRMACQNGFEPDGTITEDFWFQLKSNDYIWDTMDTSIAAFRP